MDDERDRQDEPGHTDLLSARMAQVAQAEQRYAAHHDRNTRRARYGCRSKSRSQAE